MAQKWHLNWLKLSSPEKPPVTETIEFSSFYSFLFGNWCRFRALVRCGLVRTCKAWSPTRVRQGTAVCLESLSPPLSSSRSSLSSLSFSPSPLRRVFLGRGRASHRFVNACTGVRVRAKWRESHVTWASPFSRLHPGLLIWEHCQESLVYRTFTMTNKLNTICLPGVFSSDWPGLSQRSKPKKKKNRKNIEIVISDLYGSAIRWSVGRKR